jgi:small subunit ribosomal protein S14
MTTKNYTKVLKQLKVNPTKMRKYLKHSAKRKELAGLANKKCSRCGRVGGHVGQYGLNLCRHCFREIAKEIGFKKYN